MDVTRTRHRSRSGGLSTLLPAMLLLAVMGTAGGTATASSSPGGQTAARPGPTAPPLVDLTVSSGR